MKAVPIAVFLLLALLAVYLIAPMGSPEFAITFDAAGIAAKEAFLADAAAGSGGGAQGPNIVVLLADDLGYWDCTLYGDGAVPTPHIDAIAEAGVRFTQAYATAPICSASRASMLTGRYQQRFGYETQPANRYPANRLEYLAFKYLIDTGDWRVADIGAVPLPEDVAKQGLPPQEITLPELLKTQGYTTGLMGKWHLGYTETFAPRNWGFDEFYGFIEAFSLYALVGTPGIVDSPHDYFADRYIWSQGRSGPSAIQRNGVTVEEPEYLTFAIAREARDFITRHAAEPFFLLVSFSAPHTPFQAPQAYYDRFAHVEDENTRVYHAMIAALDDAIGSITDTLAAQGLDDDTLLFFASDNGGAAYTGATDNGPFTGGKFNFFEGGVRVPMAARWPGVLPAGADYDAPVSLMDVFATGAVAAGAPLPEDRPIDGVDLVPFLTGARQDAPHETLYWRALHYKAVRQGDYKIVLDEKSGSMRLHDLAADPNEAHDLSDLESARVGELRSTLTQWEAGLAAPLWPRVMDYHFVLDGEDFFCPL